VPAPLDHSGSTERRLDRVETDVAALSSAMSGVQHEVRGFGQSLATIIETLKTRDQDARAAKVNPLALASVLVTIILALITGAWATGSQYARLDERDIQRDRQVAQMQREIEKQDRRQWEMAQ